MLHQLTQATFLCACTREGTSKEESSVNMKIFICLRSPGRTTGPTFDDTAFFLSKTLMTKFGMYPVIHMESTDLVDARAAVTKIQMYYKIMIQNALDLFHERCMQEKMYICIVLYVH